MKYLLMLFACLCLVGTTACYAEGQAYADEPTTYTTGTVEFCDDYGCRMVNAPYYYSNGEVIYWDVHFGCWIGPHGYLLNHVWHRGWVNGYHTFYHRGFYHPRGTFHGGGYHGSYHGGGHGGGHGGHR